MKRPVSLRFGSSWGRDHCEWPLAASQRRDRRSRLYHSAARSSGYTLVEILVATTLSLLLLGAVVRMFGDVGQGITNSRAMLEAADRLRLAATRLQQDLAGVTVTMAPPRKPENNEGYFEYIEGPVGLPPPGMTPNMTLPWAVAKNTTDGGSTDDTTAGDFDDILMFTTRSTGRPFVGKFGAGGTIQSDVAEVAWFIRGRTLHRRVLLVAPSASGLPANTTDFYTNYDVSVHLQIGVPVANTLGDLTRRECRFARIGSFPYDARVWRWTSGSLTMPTLPTLRECAASGWLPTLPGIPPPVTNLDFWSNDANRRLSDEVFLGSSSNLRIADDVILTNVIGFDVKAWDPTAAAYVDLGYNPTGTATYFNGWGDTRSSLHATSNSDARVYDTYSTHYEYAPVSGSLTGTPGRAYDGFDDASVGTVGIVDDVDELRTSPPYPYPLRGVQVKIRVFEPDSRQIREVTVVQDFLPQ